MIDVLRRTYAAGFVLALTVLVAPSARSEAATGVVIKCGIPQPCALYKNFIGWGFQGITAGTSGFHAGLQGADVSTNDGNNDGVLGSVINGGYGVEGTSGDSASGGVRGSGTTGTGVTGQSTSGDGVFGRSSTESGVFGESTSYVGVYGSSSTSVGMYAASISSVGAVGSSGSNTGVLGESGTGYGVQGSTTTSDAGHFASTGTGTAVAAFSGTGYGLFVETGGSVGAYVTNSNGNGTDISGSYIGLLGRSDSYPLVLTNIATANLFYVDSSGNVFSHGTYRTFATTRTGQTATAYSTQTTTPNVEDVGSAELVNGSALVRFDPAFAASIDLQTAYHVFLTPGGDTRGLFIASKTPSGFLVRETQGGRGTLSFDYRIVARALGHAREHMAFVDASSAEGPRAPFVTYRPHPAPALPRPALEPKTRAGRSLKSLRGSSK